MCRKEKVQLNVQRFADVPKWNVQMEVHPLPAAAATAGA